jgi:hypothetical protein
MDSNWGCYPPCKVAKNEKPSAYLLGCNLLLQLNLPTSYSEKSKSTQHNLGPSLWASIFVDLIPTTSTEKQNGYIQ